MDEQRTWIRSRRKKHLRIAAVILCVCLLVTTYPDILAALSAFATEWKDSTVHVSGFVELPEAVRAQTVPLGTGEEELSLPDTLEAFAATAENTNPSEDAEQSGKPEGEDADKLGDSGEVNENQPEKPDGEDENQSENPEEKDGNQPENSDGEGTNPPVDVTVEQGDGSGDTGNPENGNDDATVEPNGGGTQNSDGDDSGSNEDVEQSAEDENADTEESDGGNNDAETEPQNDSAPADGDGGVLSVQSGVFVMPAYMAEPVATAETQTLERKEGTVMIKGVTWQSEPAYDGDVEGTYIFTAVLPEGYALSEGVNLPQITVTVQENGEAAEDTEVQTLIARITALPDVQEYMEKEPDIDNWKGDGDAYEEVYEEWMEGLSAYAEEALDIWEAYEALTVEQQAQIPAEALQKLTAWVELAEQFVGSRKVMAAAEEQPLEGSNLTWKLEGNTLTISGTGPMPAWDNSQAMPWYESRNSIETVVLTNGVTSIAKYAFYYHRNLASVTIPASVTSIGYDAFIGCSALTSVTIPASVTSIGNSAFSVCNALTSVTIPDGVTSIGSSAFKDCRALKTVTISASVKSIGSTAFANCYALNSVTFKGTTTIPTLGNLCFSSCESLGEGSINIPSCKYLTISGWSSYKNKVNRNHELTQTEAKPATCVATGNEEYWKCTACNSLFSDSAGATVTTLEDVTITELDHSYTYTANNTVITEKCGLGCNHSATATLSIKSGANLTYTGSAIKPVTVTYSTDWAGTGTKKPAESSITYTNYTNAGTATAKLTISGATASKNFTIKPAAISDATVTLDSTALTYNGSGQTKTVTGVTVGDRTLIEGTDYTISGNTETEAGTHTITITGTGNYTGTVTKDFTITGKMLTETMVALAFDSDVYTGEEIKPTVMVQDGSKTLTETTDYTVSYTDNTNAGTATVTVTGTGNYAGTVTKQFTITGEQLTDGMVTLAADSYVYTGMEITPAVTVKDGNKLLTENINYTVSFTNNTNVGTATVTVTGTGNYTGAVTKTFDISPADISSAVVELGAELTYNGMEQTQTITSVTVNGRELAAGTDYTVSGNAGTNAGGYELTITGKDNYTGTATKSFTIARKPLAVSMVTLDARYHDYTGEEIKPAVTVKDGDTTLESGKDYSVDYANNTEIGTGATVTVTGKGNYTGTAEVKFVIRNGNVTPPDIKGDDLDIGFEGGTIALPDGIKDEVEIYTDPDDPEGSMITPNPDGSLPVEPGDTIYIRYKEKDETTPASDGIKIEIPGRPAAPEPVEKEEITVTDTTITVPKPDDGKDYEYVLVEKGKEPDWNNPTAPGQQANDTGEFTDLDPNKEYDLYVREKATEDSFASEPAKTEIKTPVTIKEPVIEGENADKPDNTVTKPDAPDEDGSSVTYTGTCGEDYTPVITVDGKEVTPDITWDEDGKTGEWTYTVPVVDGKPDVAITVEFKEREYTGLRIVAEAGKMSIYADNAANKSETALLDYLKANCVVKAEYDNQTSEAVTTGADYTTQTGFDPKGAVYEYTVEANGDSGKITLTVNSLTATVKSPDVIMKSQKTGGYTVEEVCGWLPEEVTVTYAGADYTARTEKTTVTWDTTSIGADFGALKGSKTINGTATLPDWATGGKNVSIEIRFDDNSGLTDEQMKLTISSWTYGAQIAPAPEGSVTVNDTDQTYTYLYSADNGASWVAVDKLPKSGSGNIIPGTYLVKMTYTGKAHTGTKTASFTVLQKPLTVGKGTLEVENRKYNGTTNAALKKGGQPELSGVIAGDNVASGGTLSAVFANKGPKKDIPVTVTGFELTGSDAKYYRLANTTLTLTATISKAGGGSSSGGSGGNGGSSGNNGSGDNNGSGGSSGNGENSGSGGTSGNSDNSGSGGTSGNSGNNGNGGNTGNGSAYNGTVNGDSDKKIEAQQAEGKTGQSGQGTKAGSTDATGQNGTAQSGSGQQMESGTVQTVQASADDGRIVISGETETHAATGNLTDDSPAATRLLVGDGTVIVTVVCEDGKYTAGANDAVSVANAVLTPEQIQLVDNGETMEVRVDIRDISNSVPPQDMETVGKGYEAYGKYLTELSLGAYVDISVYVKNADGVWDAITETSEPVEIVIGIPEELQSEGREYYIIRAHNGEYNLLEDMDDELTTITVRTAMFSSYAIAYRQIGEAALNHKCGLCHICPTLFGVCCFIWMAVIAAGGFVAVIVILIRKKETEKV